MVSTRVDGKADGDARRHLDDDRRLDGVAKKGSPLQEVTALHETGDVLLAIRSHPGNRHGVDESVTKRVGRIVKDETLLGGAGRPHRDGVERSRTKSRELL